MEVKAKTFLGLINRQTVEIYGELQHNSPCSQYRQQKEESEEIHKLDALGQG